SNSIGTRLSPRTWRVRPVAMKFLTPVRRFSPPSASRAAARMAAGSRPGACAGVTGCATTQPPKVPINKTHANPRITVHLPAVRPNIELYRWCYGSALVRPANKIAQTKDDGITRIVWWKFTFQILRPKEEATGVTHGSGNHSWIREPLMDPGTTHESGNYS